MRKLPRRGFLHLAAGAAALPIIPRYAAAQAYPTRPVRIISGYTSGGVTSIMARLMGHWLSERLGQQFIVENRPGAATNIATEAVVRTPGDGYSLLLASGANAINATLYEKLNFNFIRDIAPIAGITRVAPRDGGPSIDPNADAPGVSSPMPKRTRARLVWRRPALAARHMRLANCSR
jgi:Tripartite tricarboxylate transporter family receptor